MLRRYVERYLVFSALPVKEITTFLLEPEKGTPQIKTKLPGLSNKANPHPKQKLQGDKACRTLVSLAWVTLYPKSLSD